ncbi:MAG: DNA mismatch repair endonuclease MutL [Clostridia bacterium]|nr:DNA mismatch repair endonuclease MutL [Clostridia bacterium]
MAKINILDSSIYNLIAAGEVVERPASVIKELVENSIDAGAKSITVEIKNGGISFMQVSDDGSGIDEGDMKSAFLPHATSKIKEAADLESILTLGFRGEALASIASVSKVKLVSKTEKDEVGNSIVVEGGKFGEIEKVSCNTGTVITVEDLFFCVPARAKFLKKPKTEEQEITNIISRTILAHPTINFVYIVDGKKQLSSLGKNEKEAMFSIYGKESVTETLEVSAKREGVEVFGYVGKPTFSKSNRTYQTLIINGRYVVNLTVQTAVANAYGDFLMKRQYPFFVLYLTMPADEIDVNVHPNKLDVKFLKSNLVYSVVFEAVSRALHEMDYVKIVDTETNAKVSYTVNQTSSSKIDKAGVNLNPFSTNFSKLDEKEKEKISDVVIDTMISSALSSETGVRDNFGLGSKLLERINTKIVEDEKEALKSTDYNLKNQTQIEKIEEEKVEVQTALFEEEKPVQENVFVKTKSQQTEFVGDDIKIVGKFFNTYLAIEWGDNIYLIDQHAGHERLNYDKLKKEYEEKNIVVQPMLIPFVLSLNAEDDQIVNDNLEAIRSVGFEIDEFGERTYKISAVPAIVSDIDFNKFFGMFLAEKINKTKITEAELIKDSLMQMACKSAIKGGDDLSKNEINLLLSEMGNNNVVLFCPHGRPVVVRITKAEVEKWFKRIV